MIIIILIEMSISRKACKTEIFLAIENGDTEQVRRMIDAYPDLVHIRSQTAWSPIKFAVRYG